jgi:hypothetical protein
MERKVSPVDELRLSLELLPALASAIRRLRIQRTAEQTTPPPPQATPAMVPEPEKYRQNKWEASPAG